jgi:hypothetical protein
MRGEKVTTYKIMVARKLKDAYSDIPLNSKGITLLVLRHGKQLEENQIEITWLEPMIEP